MKRHPAVAATMALLLLFFSAGQATAQENLPRLVKKIQPAVVTIIAYDKQGKVICQGSGFFINQDGHFLTNYHVLAGANRALVKTADGRRYPVERMVAEDKDGDLVVAAVEAPRGGLPSLKISGVLPEVGEKVAVVGSPFGLEQTLSDGVVSAVRRIPKLGEILQITAPLSPGSSGSPVVNMKGEVVGVATFLFKEGQNLNFAVSGNRVLALQQRASKLTTGQRPDLNSYSDAELAKIAGVALTPPSIADKESTSTKVFLDQAGTFCKAGNYEKVVEAYKQAVLSDPNFAPARRNLGWAYLVLGRYQEASESLRLSIRLQPKDIDSHFLLGRAYLSLGNRNEALKEYKILKTLDPGGASKLLKLIDDTD